MIIGVPKETRPEERRVALVPGVLPQLTKAGYEVVVEPGAGADAGYPDGAYEKGGAKLAPRAEVFAKADVIVLVNGPGANPGAGDADLALLRQGQYLICQQDALTAADSNAAVAKTGAILLAMELVPRITRAQSMDVLSSMASLAGYKAVIMAADALPKIFPMMSTAAGTIAPAKVFIMGAGVAGLQAIATAKRLGAVVEAYDVRSAVKDQIQSLGAKFVEIEVASTGAEDKGGYAKDLGEEFYRKQREMLSKVVAASDVVITTAAIPGKKSPVLVTAEMARGMKPGSVIVDLAAERGGNCELTQGGKTVVDSGVTIMGPVNLPSTIPFHASQTYAKNVQTFILNLGKKGTVELNLEDEIVKGTLVTREGVIVHERAAGFVAPAAPAEPAQA
jgi:H+-translocating NAD(P) transhydrogenase subunit alpha